MRRGSIKKFGRVRNQRAAFCKALATALIKSGKIKTTVVRARETSRLTDKLITVAKKGDLASRRILGQYLDDKAVKKLVKDIAPGFEGKKGGYTRVLRIGQRASDAAEMAIVEWTI